MRTLLMMDGDQVLLNAVERTARSLGFSVFAAKNGEEFRQLYRCHAPDVILLGIVMPEVDGFELTAWLCEEGARVHLLLISGHTPLYAKWLSHLVEVNGVMSAEILQKPLDQTALVAALEGLARSPVPRKIQEGSSNGTNDTTPRRDA